MYEYKIESYALDDLKDVESHMNELGVDSWELVEMVKNDSSCITIGFFKRQTPVLLGPNLDQLPAQTNSIKLYSYPLEGNGPIWFNVPTSWAAKEIYQYFGWTLKEFLNEYTYDNSEMIYQEAKKQNMILGEGEL